MKRMNTNPVAIVAGLALLAGAAACGGGDEAESSTTTREVITQPGTEQVEVTVPTVDTAVVRRTVETEVDVDVDTIQDPAIERTNP